VLSRKIIWPKRVEERENQKILKKKKTTGASRFALLDNLLYQIKEKVTGISGEKKGIKILARGTTWKN
jgi:hypothetical protein